MLFVDRTDYQMGNLVESKTLPCPTSLQRELRRVRGRHGALSARSRDKGS
jgi:hypothetical protein